MGETNEKGQLLVRPIELVEGFNELRANVTETTCVGKTAKITIDPKHRLTLITGDYNRGICDGRQENGAKLIGLASYVPITPMKCSCNYVNALANRHLKVMPPKVRNFDKSQTYLHSFISDIKSEYHQYQLGYTEVDWMAKWPRTKQKQIEISVGDDKLEPGKCKSFIKREVYVKEQLKKCRLIQGYFNMATQAHTGYRITCLQKAFAKVMDGSRSRNGIDVTFASGMTNLDFSAWMRKTNMRKCWFYERDGESWDSTMDKPHYATKWPIYDAIDEELGRFMRKCENTKCTIHTPSGKIKYKTKATTKSGHNDTSLGNSIINASIALEAMLEMNLQGRILVMGDDLLVAVYSDFDAERFAEIERELGINPEYNKFSDWRDVTFISARWYPTGRVEEYLFAPKVSSILDKLFWTVKPLTPAKEAEMREAICKCVNVIMPDFPIVKEFIQANRTGAIVSMVVDEFKYAYIFNKHQRANYGEVYRHLLDLYHLLPSELDSLLRLIKENAGRIGVLKHDTIDKLRQVDRADIATRPLFGVYQSL